MEMLESMIVALVCPAPNEKRESAERKTNGC